VGRGLAAQFPAQPSTSNFSPLGLTSASLPPPSPPATTGIPDPGVQCDLVLKLLTNLADAALSLIKLHFMSITVSKVAQQIYHP